MKPNVIFTAIIKFKSVQVSATLQQNGCNVLVTRLLYRCRYLLQMVADTHYLQHSIKQQILYSKRYNHIYATMVSYVGTPVSRLETPVPKHGNRSFCIGKLKFLSADTLVSQYGHWHKCRDTDFSLRRSLFSIA